MGDCVTFEQPDGANYVVVRALPNQFPLGRIRGRAFIPEDHSVLTLDELLEIGEYMYLKATPGPRGCDEEVTA